MTDSVSPSPNDPPAAPPPRAADLDVSVILPAFNEADAIVDDLRDVRSAMESAPYSYEIIVVDDGSTDATASLVAALDWVHLVSHPYNRGTGAARTTGIRVARGRIVAFTDADRTYPNDRLPDLVAAVAQGADMAIGARRVESGSLRLLRAPAKAALRRLAEFMTGSRIPDLNSGLRAQRRDVTVRYLSVLPTGHSWVSTVTIAFLSGGFIVGWIPVDYFPRVGHSTFHPIRDTYGYLTLIVRTVMYFNPLKVFLPLALAFLVAATTKYLVYDLWWRFGPGLPPFVPPMPGTTLALLFTGLQISVVGLLADLIVRRTRL
ncbi:MAG: glycosyltransferase family 2 protein [Anaerolineae bacterium]